MGKSFEDVISQVGGFGKFQVMVVGAVFGTKFFAGWSMMQMAFAGMKPDFYCLTDAGAGNGHHGYVSHNTTESVHGSGTEGNLTLNKCSVNGSACIEHQFNTSIRTAGNEWDLVCDLSWVKATTTSVQMAGVLLGAVLSGQLGDMFGRKKTLYGSFLLHGLLNVAIVFSQSWQAFMAFRFLIGTGIGSILVVCLPYPIEFVPKRNRAAIPIIPMWTGGVCMFALFAYLLQNWRHLHLACAACSAPLLLGWFFVPESIRWLTVQGRAQDAYDAFEKMATINGKALPEDTMKTIQAVAEEEKKIREDGRKYSYLDIFRGPGMVKNSFAFAFMWCSLSMVFYGLGFGVSGLAGNVYLNIFLLSFVDIPSVLATFWTSNRFGRRYTCASMFLVGALAGFGVMATQLAGNGSNKHVLTIVLTLVSKSAVAAAWVASQSWIIEIYPTVTRNLGYGFVNMCARVGGIIAPFAINMEDRMVLTYTLIGAFLLTSSCLALVCTETKGKALADSMALHHVTSSTNQDAAKGDNQWDNPDVTHDLSAGKSR